MPHPYAAKHSARSLARTKEQTTLINKLRKTSVPFAIGVEQETGTHGDRKVNTLANAHTAERTTTTMVEEFCFASIQTRQPTLLCTLDGKCLIRLPAFIIHSPCVSANLFTNTMHENEILTREQNISLSNVEIFLLTKPCGRSETPLFNRGFIEGRQTFRSEQPSSTMEQ